MISDILMLSLNLQKEVVMYRVMVIDGAGLGLEHLIGCHIVQKKFLRLFWFDVGKVFFSKEEAETYIKNKV